MSYRAFKKLLGETSLERKCRWLLGATVVVLMTGSFWVYAIQTEGLAHDQLKTTGRTLVAPVLARLHVRGEHEEAMRDFARQNEANWPARSRGTTSASSRCRSPPADAEHRAEPDDMAAVSKVSETGRTEWDREADRKKAYYYYAALRAGPSRGLPPRPGDNGPTETASPRPEARRPDGRRPHPPHHPATSKKASTPTARSSSRSPSARTLLILAGSYLTDPLRDREAGQAPQGDRRRPSPAGELNIRSEIQTGDEFEDLSHAFNRMIRNLDEHPGAEQEAHRRPRPQGGRVGAREHGAVREATGSRATSSPTMSHELRDPAQQHHRVSAKCCSRRTT